VQPYVIWQARPVFVTSTFLDMHAERDYLRCTPESPTPARSPSVARAAVVDAPSGEKA
jgi:hypothetical protein